MDSQHSTDAEETPTFKDEARPEREESPFRKKRDGDMRVYTGTQAEDVDVVHLVT